MAKEAPYYHFNVSYEGKHFFDKKQRQTVENGIVEAVGKGEDDTGMGFGRRDMGFMFKTRRDADRAKARLVAMTGLIASYGIEVEEVIKY